MRVCFFFLSKAIHIELVGDLNTNGFITALGQARHQQSNLPRQW